MENNVFVGGGNVGRRMVLHLGISSLRVIILGPSGRNAWLKSFECEARVKNQERRITSDEMVVEAEAEHELRERGAEGSRRNATCGKEKDKEKLANNF